ncbi:MAG: tRNA adenosine(34) deaminase TadA [Kiritimatiellae bacterium]|nr:tRNA adenosine(34) deaminase TadA [Kiritimatiellia bacterium]
MDDSDDIKFMEMALREAEKAADDGEVPTGCVVVDAAGRILGRAHNQTEGLVDATAHAEMLALTAAFNATGNWRLVGTTLYVTKEPCPMCAGAIVLARVERVVWGVSDEKRGGSTVFDLFRHPGMNHHPATTSGLLADRCRAVIVDFFRNRRAGLQRPPQGPSARASRPTRTDARDESP